jgi:uncharacterized protein (TIGR02147 family)
MVSVFNFQTAQAYLGSFLEALPKRGHGESKRIAAAIGVSSTFISQVLAGTKNLSPEHGERLAEYLGLAPLEADFLFQLILLDRAGTESLRQYLRSKLKELKERSHQIVNVVQPQRILSDEEKAIFYSNFLYSSVHLFCSTGKGGRTLDDVIERFELSRARAAEIVRFLNNAGLLAEKAGRYSMTSQSTHVSKESPHLLKHHANWRIKAIQASENLSDEELIFTGQVSLSKADFEELRQGMGAYIKQFLDKVHESPAEEIACLNLDWFWIRK